MAFLSRPIYRAPVLFMPTTAADGSTRNQTQADIVKARSLSGIAVAVICSRALKGLLCLKITITH